MASLSWGLSDMKDSLLSLPEIWLRTRWHRPGSAPNGHDAPVISEYRTGRRSLEEAGAGQSRGAGRECTHTSTSEHYQEVGTGGLSEWPSGRKVLSLLMFVPQNVMRSVPSASPGLWPSLSLTATPVVPAFSLFETQAWLCASFRFMTPKGLRRCRSHSLP